MGRLRAYGHEVEVLTTFPSYPGGKLYPGYRQRWHQVEHIKGIRIVRVPTYINHNKSAIKRLFSYISFGFVSALYILFARRQFDVFYAYYPPVVIGALAIMVGALRRTPFVYDVQDLWPEVLVATGQINKESRLVFWINGLSDYIYRKASGIIVLSEGYRQALIAKGVSPEKVVRVYNWCDESRMRKGCHEPRSVFNKDNFNILYAGNLGTAQALVHVIEAARLLHEQKNYHIRFFFLGTGVAEASLKKIAEHYKLSNIQFLPQVPIDSVGDYLEAADALLVHLEDDPVFSMTIPQKVQAYMHARRPILIAVRGEACELIKSSGAGIAVEPCNSRELAAAATAMSRLPAEKLQLMADQGFAFYKKYMSMDNGVEAVDAILRSLPTTR